MVSIEKYETHAIASFLPAGDRLSFFDTAKNYRRLQNFEFELINDHVMRLGVITGIYDQHYHPNSDELFIGIDRKWN